MGNCINLLNSSQKKLEALDFNGGKGVEEQGLKTEEGKASSPVPLMADSGNRSKPKRVKVRRATISVTKEQLEFLMKNVKKFKSRGISFTFPGETCEKWKPFLPTIPEGFMDVPFPAKLVQYRHQITTTIISVLLLSLLVYSAPRFLAIVAYFWPLFLSTAVLFLVAAIGFGGASMAADEVSQIEKPAQEMLSYVAQHPENTDSQKVNQI